MFWRTSVTTYIRLAFWKTRALTPSICRSGVKRVTAVLKNAAAGKALIRWQCTLETKRGPAAWRGLDIIHVVNGRITEKLTYAKAKVPLLGEIA